MTLEPAPAAPTTDQSPDRFQIDLTTVEATAALPPSDDPVQGYKADVATTATRSALPLKETPASIGVVTSDHIRGTFSRTQNEAFEQVSGVSRSNTRLGRGEGINIRGFEVNSFSGSFSGLKANGLPTDGVFAPDPALIERYEILKGPASIVGGAANPGGVVNRITKRPLGENFITVEPQVGSFDFYRGMVDINGVLPQYKNLRGRLILAYEDGGKFVDDVEERQYTIAPSLETDLFGGAGTLLLTGHYQDFDGSSYPGFPLLANGEVPDIPRTRNFGGGSDAGAETRFSGYNGELHYEHEFVSNLRLSVKGKYSWSDLSDKIVYAYAYGGLPESGDVNMSAALRENEFETYAGEIFLSKEFDALGQRHELLAGIDHRDQTQDFFNGYQYVGFDNIFDPANDFEAPADAVLEAAANMPFRVQLKQTGVFTQAITRPIERLTLVAALTGPIPPSKISGQGTKMTKVPPSSLPNNIKTDSYERVDAVLFYRYRDDLDFALNVRNLLDETYIENPGGLNAYNSFGAPTTILLRIRYKF